MNGIEKVIANRSTEVVWRVFFWWQAALRGLIYALTLLALVPVAMATSVPQKSFASPEEAVSALVDAVKANDQSALRAILGPHSGKLTNSGDPVEDQQNRERFINSYGKANKIVLESDTKAVLVIGENEWPMPIPLVKSGDSWHFDAKQGKQEILHRRIGRNELAAIQVCLAIVDAERDYATLDLDGSGIPKYAAKLVSTPDKRDGLYWETTADEQKSPLGPLLAVAASKGYTRTPSATLTPYYGYYYKILTKQGKDALGGAYDYLVKGKMIGGFALIAYPARHRASGVMSFIVNQDGVIYEKDLGKNTASIAAKMTVFNPDTSWKEHH